MNQDERGVLLLHALLSGEEDKALKLLKEDVNLNIIDRGDYAIHLAARRGYLKVIRKMRNKGAHLNQKNTNGNAPIHYAAKEGYVHLVKYLKRKKAHMNALNNDGNSPLHNAVIKQSMNIVEQFVDFGMDPNIVNVNTGETPLHVALKYGRQEAMEGLLIKGAMTDVRDKNGKLPEDVAQNRYIRDIIRMYATMFEALKSRCILSNDIILTRECANKKFKIDRVGIIIDAIEISSKFVPGLYCRREKAENATVTLKAFEEEHVYSDVFHIRMFDTNRVSHTKMFLPIYAAPSDKEEIVLRFINSANKDQIVSEILTEGKINYCTLETILVPDTTSVCIVYVRQKQEILAVSNDGQVIVSEIEKDFSLDIPPNCFEGDTQLTLKVFESNADINVDDEAYNEIEPVNASNQSTIEAIELLKQDTQHKSEVDDKATVPNSEKESEEEKEIENFIEVNQPSLPEERFDQNQSLLTDVYQIGLSGQQPNKGIMVQMPLCKDMDAKDEELVIVRVDENGPDGCTEITVLPIVPVIRNTTLIFEASHFSVYVATWKSKVETIEHIYELQTQIQCAKEKRKPANIFAVVKWIEDLKHIILIECGVSNRSCSRRNKWLEIDFEEQNPKESESVMMAPGDTFFIRIEGNANLENEEETHERKIQFSQCRPSFQPYRVLLRQNIYTPEDAKAIAVISQKTDDGLKEVARLTFQLHAPPRPPSPPLLTVEEQTLQPTPTPSPPPAPATPPPLIIHMQPTPPAIDILPSPELPATPKAPATPEPPEDLLAAPPVLQQPNKFRRPVTANPTHRKKLSTNNRPQSCIEKTQTLPGNIVKPVLSSHAREGPEVRDMPLKSRSRMQ